jgi:hypothetical protein
MFFDRLERKRREPTQGNQWRQTKAEAEVAPAHFELRWSEPARPPELQTLAFRNPLPTAACPSRLLWRVR